MLCDATRETWQPLLLGALGCSATGLKVMPLWPAATTPFASVPVGACATEPRPAAATPTPVGRAAGLVLLAPANTPAPAAPDCTETTIPALPLPAADTTAPVTPAAPAPATARLAALLPAAAETAPAPALAVPIGLASPHDAMGSVVTGTLHVG
jgi:hypothetical protein